MRLQLQSISDWPKLAWSARMSPNDETIFVRHGPCVEEADDWCAEAVWAGQFAAGDFDQTESVFGTGIRLRDAEAVFVSAGTMMDRLWHCQRDGKTYVSNSLPCLLATADLSLRDDYSKYQTDIETQQLGLNRYVGSLPADPCDLRLTYYRNLHWNGHTLREVDKPDTCPGFHTYAEYHEFLRARARQLGVNLADEHRKFKVEPLAGVSKGYDSCAAAAIAREAGCRNTVTIANASSLFPRSDSGREVAGYLGMSCEEYRHTHKAYRREETIWSAAGRPAGLNFTIFNYPEPLCVIFTGYRGDSMWRRERLDRSQPFRANCSDGLGLAEFRLHQGLFHCLVPFLGSQKAAQVQDITFSEEMTPWTIGGRYDRPIPRRILEEAGVPRHAFGTRKEATYPSSILHWPFSARASESFRSYLRQRGLRVPETFGIECRRWLRAIDQFAVVNLKHLIGLRIKGLRPYIPDLGAPMIMQWSNHVLKAQYQEAVGTADQLEFYSSYDRCRDTVNKTLA
ncbi:MAG: hypothetical protein ACYC4U_32390 [Pirellulaceae bacterium]